MKFAAFFLGTAALLSLPVRADNGEDSVAEGPSRISAFQALEAVMSQYGAGYGGRIARIEGFSGQDQPEEWVIYSYDYHYVRRIDQFIVRGGRVVEAKLLTAAASVPLSTSKFSATTDLLDSQEIFAFAEAAARRAKTGFDSADYVLYFDAERQLPVYRIALKNDRGDYVGGMILAATSRLNGEEFWSDWPGSSDPGEQAKAEARRAKDEVEDFFKDFGSSVRDVFRNP